MTKHRIPTTVPYVSLRYVKALARYLKGLTGVSDDEIFHGSGVDSAALNSPGESLIAFAPQIQIYANMARLAAEHHQSGFALSALKARDMRSIGALNTGVFACESVEDAFNFNKKYLAAAGGPFLFDWQHLPDGKHIAIQAVCQTEYSPVDLLMLVTEDTLGVWALSNMPTAGLAQAAHSLRFAYPEPQHIAKYHEVVPDGVDLYFDQALAPGVAMEAWLPSYVLKWEVPSFDPETLSAVKLLLNQRLTCIGEGDMEQAVATVLFRNVDRHQRADVWRPQHVADELRKTVNRMTYELDRSSAGKTFQGIRDDVRKALFLRFKHAHLGMKDITMRLGFRHEDYLKRKVRQWFPNGE